MPSTSSSSASRSIRTACLAARCGGHRPAVSMRGRRADSASSEPPPDMTRRDPAPRRQQLRRRREAASPTARPRWSRAQRPTPEAGRGASPCRRHRREPRRGSPPCPPARRSRTKPCIGVHHPSGADRSCRPPYSANSLRFFERNHASACNRRPALVARTPHVDRDDVPKGVDGLAVLWSQDGRVGAIGCVSWRRSAGDRTSVYRRRASCGNPNTLPAGGARGCLGKRRLARFPSPSAPRQWNSVDRRSRASSSAARWGQGRNFGKSA